MWYSKEEKREQKNSAGVPSCNIYESALFFYFFFLAFFLPPTLFMQAIFGSTVWAAGATCRTRVVRRPEGFGPPPPKLDLEDVLFEVSTIPKFCRLISSSDGCFSSKKTTSGA